MKYAWLLLVWLPLAVAIGLVVALWAGWTFDPARMLAWVEWVS